MEEERKKKYEKSEEGRENSFSSPLLPSCHTLFRTGEQNKKAEKREKKGKKREKRGKREKKRKENEGELKECESCKLCRITDEGEEEAVVSIGQEKRGE